MPKFTVGDAVVLKTHPFLSSITDIIISGEYLMIPPIMIVTEIINHGDEPAEKPIVNKYKCVWFSSKRNQFQESNLLETDLRALGIDGALSDQLIPGVLVALKTQPLELSKERSFLHSELSGNSSKKTNSMNGLLTFVSPVMALSEIVKNDKEKDNKTSPDIKRKKHYAEYLAKCKWFDAAGEKFSETFLPLQALIVLPEPPHQLLETVENAIVNDLYLITEDTIIRPIQISNRSGVYYVTYLDYILNKNSNKKVADLVTAKTSKNPFKAHAPIFKKRKKAGKNILKLTTDIETTIANALRRKKRNYVKNIFHAMGDLIDES